jgi:hypothetical protein
VRASSLVVTRDDTTIEHHEAFSAYVYFLPSDGNKLQSSSYVCHSLLSPPSSDDAPDPEASVAEVAESELESDDPEPPFDESAFRAFRAFRLAARRRQRAARRGVTANGSATAAAETAASREGFFFF